MVRDGIYYGLAFLLVAVLVGWFTAVPALVAVPLLLAAFFLWFFRDPERRIPAIQGAIVSPADGKVTDISVVQVRRRAADPNQHLPQRLQRACQPLADQRRNRRGPLSEGQVRQRHGRGFRRAERAEHRYRAQATPAVVVFKQIAGLLARRIVFTKKVGDRLERGERVGLIKFGSRTDVIFPAGADMKVRVGENVKGGSTVLAIAQPLSPTGSVCAM